MSEYENNDDRAPLRDNPWVVAITLSASVTGAAVAVIRLVSDLL